MAHSYKSATSSRHTEISQTTLIPAAVSWTYGWPWRCAGLPPRARQLRPSAAHPRPTGRLFGQGMGTFSSAMGSWPSRRVARHTPSTTDLRVTLSNPLPPSSNRAHDGGVWWHEVEEG